MESFLYKIKELWILHNREIKRYGVCALLVYASIWHRSLLAGLIGVGAALVMWCYDRWGRPWAERGKEFLKGNQPPKK
jgi:hypothetical protein